jgi:death on curing protein
MSLPVFLTLAEVIEIYNNQIELYGGKRGVREIRLLESAISQPEASFQGEWLHDDLYLMAAAYAYHISSNHPFVDGNKRTALATALVFLEINGISIIDPTQKLLDAMRRMAAGKLNKDGFAKILKSAHK